MYDGLNTFSGRADGQTTPIPQYYAVQRTGTNDYFLAPTSADVRIDGVIQERCDQEGQSITVATSGRTKVIAGAAFSIGDPLRCDNVGRLVEAKASATITSGANTSLVWTETDAGRGKMKSVSYENPGIATHTGYIENKGGNIVVHLTTDGAGAITETADSVKTLLAAHAELAALVAAVDSAGHDGSGTLTAEPAIPFTGAENICAKALEAASGAGSEVDVLLDLEAN